ncbi:phospholipase D-like domain-containing protein [Glycomyces tarimensis]
MTWTVAQGPRPTRTNSVEFLIDNEDAWGRLVEQIDTARRSVRCMLFMLDVPHVRMAFPEEIVGAPDAPGSIRLEERLLEAANRGVEVSILLNHVEPAVSLANTSRAVEDYFKRHRPADTLRLRRLRTPQSVPIHAKVFTIDDEVAFSIGSVFVQEYFDGPEHRIDDPRRGHQRWRSSVLAPTHDVSARLTGPAVADLDAAFRLHWTHAGPDDLPKFKAPADSDTGDLPVQVTRTLHGGRYAGLPDGETGILESYLRAIANAEDFIYLENQYFTSTEIVDALVDAVRRSERLQVIALINSRPDVPGYVRSQTGALERLYAGLAAAGGSALERVGVFTAWSHEEGAIIRTHIHSKVGIIDDRWCTVGSANLDGLSLSVSEHRAQASRTRLALGRAVGVFGPGRPEHARSTEVNLTVADFDGGNGSVGPAVARLRRRLWAEHLGFDPGAPVLDQRPNGGWLALWKQRADLKLRRLGEDPDRPVESRILPYPQEDGRIPPGIAKSHVYLDALGVDPSTLDVRQRLRSFLFESGVWKS